ncbi:MAG: M18 family aminopeptidase [Candidatus Cloacimonadota bacterium]|nr:MAG: M18 family aminopeptidase [Candidatus Cloacimonadota bacterium]
MQQDQLNQQLMDYIYNSPTPYHATKNAKDIFLSNGFTELLEKDKWNVENSSKYFVCRNDSSIVAFKTPKSDLSLNGFRMAGAHTDSPCLKIKPNGEIKFKNYLKFGVETYGGILLSTWFDRDLSLAGKVTGTNKKGKLESTLIDFKAPIAIVPNLAIHLNRQANSGFEINKETHMPPICFQSFSEDDSFSFQQELLKEVQKSSNIETILNTDLSFYDYQKPNLVGLRKDFLCSARLDNLLSSYVLIESLIQSNDEFGQLIVLNDHEEVGSNSSSGACGNMLESILKRVCTNQETLSRTIDASVMISCDNAHGIHPNFPAKHEMQHAPILNLGPAIKVNANQKYASNCETSSIFETVANSLNIPIQKFVIRQDMACGSTIGPITATKLGIKTVDVGVPTFAMHSIRETAGTKDSYYLLQILKAIFETKSFFN